jgi:uncharacterized protein
MFLGQALRVLVSDALRITMVLREKIKTTLVEAMKAKQPERVATLRLAQAALKNKDIELRTAQPTSSDDDALVIDVLTKMVKQRRESIEMFEKGGRLELAAAERAEIAILEEFLPKMLDEAQTLTLIQSLITELGATGPKDMGKIIAALKTHHSGLVDLGNASKIIKAALGG